MKCQAKLGDTSVDKPCHTGNEAAWAPSYTQITWRHKKRWIPALYTMTHEQKYIFTINSTTIITVWKPPCSFSVVAYIWPWRCSLLILNVSTKLALKHLLIWLWINSTFQVSALIFDTQLGWMSTWAFTEPFLAFDGTQDKVCTLISFHMFFLFTIIFLFNKGLVSHLQYRIKDIIQSSKWNCKKFLKKEPYNVQTYCTPVLSTIIFLGDREQKLTSQRIRVGIVNG